MAKLQPDYITWVLSLNANDLQKEIHSLHESTKKLKDDNKGLRKEMADLVMQGKAGGEEWKNLNKQILENSKTIRENNTKIAECEKRLDKTTMSASQLSKKAKELSRELSNTVKSLEPEKYAALEKELKAVTEQMDRNRASAGGLFQTFSSFSKLKSAIAGIFVGFGQMIGQTFLGAIRQFQNTIKDFEFANANLAAILGTTRDKITDLTEDAKRLGAATKYTASEVTNLQTELAKLGFNKQEILEATQYVLRFAGATGAELPEAAKLAGAAIRAFGLETTDTERVVSAMAIATTRSAMDFGYLQTALSTVAPVAQAFGFTIEDTMSLLGTLANAGFDASSAATATRNILLNLADSSGKLAVALGRPITSLEELAPALKELDEEGIDLAKTLELTDKRSVAAFNAFLTGANKLIPLRDAVTDVGDELKAMSDEKMNTVQGSIKIMESAIEGLILKFYESRGVMKLVIDAFTGLINGISWCIDKFAQYRAILLPVITALSTYWATTKLVVAWNTKAVAGTAANIAIEKLHAIQLAFSRKALLAKLIALDLYKGRCSIATAVTEMFNLVLKASPIGVVAALITVAATAMYLFGNKTSVADKSISELNKKLETERASLNEIFKELKKTNPGTSERSRLVKELNDKYGYLIGNYDLETAKLQEITRAQNDANTALTNRIANEMRSQSVSEYVKNRVSAQIDTEERLLKMMRSSMSVDVFDKLKPAMTTFLQDSTKTLEDFTHQFGKYADMSISKQVEFTAFFKAMRSDQKSYSLGIDEINKKYEPYIKSIKAATTSSQEELKVQVEATSKIKQLEDRKKEVQETWKEDTKKNIRLKNQELERIDTEIRKLRELGTAKAASDAENANNKQKEKERKELLESEKKQIQSLENLRKEDLQKQQRSYNSALNGYRLMLSNKTISQSQFDIYTATLALNNAETLLSIEEKYYQQSNELVVTNEELKAKAVGEADKRVADAEQKTFDARLKTEKDYYDNLQTMRDMLQESTDNPEDRLKAEYDAQLALLKGLYETSLNYAKKNGKDEVEVERIYTDAKELLLKKYYKAKADLAKKSKGELKGIIGNELSEDVADIFNAISKLKDIFKNFSDPEFWEKFKGDILENMGALVNAVTSGLSSAFSTFKQIEKDNVEAKYNAEIAAAEGNSEEIERLEQEKAQKKLDIEKKYADIQFAIKASEIIANTALAIVMALGQLGPIAGPIAAGLMGAIGAVQLAAANAERQKVKSMTLNNTSSSSASGERVVNSPGGYDEGGYTGDGGRYEIAGAVHRGEYVVPVPEMKNKRVVNMVKVIESIRRQRTTANPLPGYYEGGHVEDRIDTQVESPSKLDKAAERLEAAANRLSQPLKSYVLLSDINDAEEIKYKSEKPFTRGDN
ncbi:phage tail tape measure protein [Bacteroides sp.]|uniref:phage tail tape measure protein n=1 Tax=Bacteroides sp. TaxID=29523 RepID=UPI0025B936ED|nr:phage tail tape measure protein [Bacteroides sp.]